MISDNLSASRSRKSMLQGGLLTLLAASTAMNFFAADRLFYQRGPIAPLSPGSHVAAIAGIDPTGAATRITYSGALPTVVYHFSPACTWCERNWSNVRALVAQTAGRYRFVAVSVQPASAAFVAARNLSFPIASGIAAETRDSYHLGGTPQTILVSPSGTVLHTWSGVYSGRQAADIESFFGVRLPGLSDAEHPASDQR